MTQTNEKAKAHNKESGVEEFMKGYRLLKNNGMEPSLREVEAYFHKALQKAEERAVQEFAISVSEKMGNHHIQAGINLINDKAYPETVGINNKP